MITRSHVKGDAPSVAVYSPCERYRYTLTRTWDGSGRKVAFVMLNPSTATEVQNDPTVERCERRARALGFSIEDCRTLLGLYENETRESAQVKAIAEEHLAAIDEKIAQLQAMRGTLSHLVEACRGDHRPDCPILTDLSGAKRSGAA